MIFATIKNLLDRVSADALAEAAAPDDTTVDGALLMVAVDGADLSAYSAADQAAVARAVARVEAALADASAEVQGFVAPRYPELNNPPHLLTVYACDIALWRLLGGDRDSEVSQNYMSAISYLRDVARGKIDIDVAADSPAASDIRISSSGHIFSEKTLAGF